MEQFKKAITGETPVFFKGVQYNGSGVDYETFDKKVKEIASRLGWDYQWIYCVIFIETAGTFSPKIKNTVSSATGLIQFMEATAKGLGTTTAKLAAMNAVQQLEYVYKYFLPYKSKVKSGYDVYTAVFYPKWLSDKDYLIKSPSDAYKSNIGLDMDKNGSISFTDFQKWIDQRNPTLIAYFNSKKKADFSSLPIIAGVAIGLALMVTKK